MSEHLLDVRDVCKFFGGVKAVNCVSFTVKPGVIKAIIGPNGAGKTTLFHLIAGNSRPSSGAVYLDGRNVTALPDHRMVHLGVARTFQTTKIFTNMTVLENVMIGRHTRTRAGFIGSALRLPAMRREEQSIREAAQKQLEFLGLKDKAEYPPAVLSFKEQRLLEFARALATEPKILLADEPAAGLNTRETKDIACLIKRINQAGITILLVEHDMSLVMDISDEILVLDYGKKIAEGAPDEIRRNEDVITVYLGRRNRGNA